MVEKDVCYITPDVLEPVYLKGQIVTVKEPNSEWSEIERGNKSPENSDIKFAVRTIYIDAYKLHPSVNKESRLDISDEDHINLLPKYVPPGVQ